ncbi:MAG TPA: MBL fold metallo-hydrolase [Nitrososphaerales archaeon]|nr:MBL fold metallo-hydrolase [Nitrososphaerales archaeon]
MIPRVTCFGGVGEVGGNKFLLEDRDTKVFLDFGSGFSDGCMYFNDTIKPRQVNGAGDLFEFGLLPEIPGLYSEQALQNTSLKHTAPEVDAVVLSHYHWDHMGRIPYVDQEVPVYCGETATLLHQASSESSSSPLDGHELRKFRTGDRFRVGTLEFVPVHVDHSIPGAYGFIIHTTKGAIVYTGDFRFHGPAGYMTKDFAKEAGKSAPLLLLTEGTRVSPGDSRRSMSERAVLDEALSLVSGKKGLILSSFRGNDVDRVNTFAEACRRTGRTLVVSMKAAMVLRKLEADKRMKVPRVGRDAMVYVRRKRSGRMDDKDYRLWERQFLNCGVTAREVRDRQSETFLHLDVWNFAELIDIKPDRGGTYIHAATEAFNEEGEQEEGVVRNWTDHLGFSYHQLHASGHAPAQGVEELIRLAKPRKVVPIHTEHPEMFASLGGRAKYEVQIPARGKPVAVSPA